MTIDATNREVSNVSGATPKQIYSSAPRTYRSAIYLRIATSSVDQALIRIVPAGSAAPVSISSANATTIMNAGDEKELRYSGYDSDVYIVGASGGQVDYIADPVVNN